MNCKVELKCKVGVGNVCRFNILIDNNKYSKVYNCDEDIETVVENAEEACKANMLEEMGWEKGWRVECRS